MNVTAVICTRGDIDLTPVLESLEPVPFEDIIVWDNSQRETDEKVYGYFAGAEEARTSFIYTQADDAICPAWELLDTWEQHHEEKILLNVADGDTPWVSFGAVFRKGLYRQAFDRYLSEFPRDDDFLLWAEVIFCELTPWVNVDLGKIDLPWAHAPNRMWKQPNHYQDQQRVRERCLSLLERV